MVLGGRVGGENSKETRYSLLWDGMKIWPHYGLINGGRDDYYGATGLMIDRVIITVDKWTPAEMPMETPSSWNVENAVDIPRAPRKCRGKSLTESAAARDHC